MPWVGVYIAAASAVCSLAMAADTFNGFRSKKFWFPCKYFSLNAFSLTVLAVAMKLPLDFASNMTETNDIIARVSSLVFMSTAMANFMTSLGSMENNEIILNLVALGILVITIAGNVCIHIVQIRVFLTLQWMAYEIKAIVIVLLLLVALCSLSIMVPTAKKNIEPLYREIHRRSISQRQVEWGEFTFGELRRVVTRYWVMTQTGSLQFVIARSVTCVASSIIYMSVTLYMLASLIRLLTVGVAGVKYQGFAITSSNYKWSIVWILVVQTLGLILGSVAPAFRLFIVVILKSSEISHRSLKDEFKVETYWTQMLVDWKDSPLPLQIRHPKLRKLLHDTKRLLLSFCIGVQVVIVLASKLLLLISAACAKIILFCFHQIKNLKASNASRAPMEQDFSPYVVLLEGEANLPTRTLKNICNEVDKLIRIGKKMQPKNLTKLLRKSVNFNGVIEFESKQIESLRSQEPPNSWSLPIVTLTSIAVAIPNITADKTDMLLRSVGEGLHFVKLIEKALDRNGELAGIRSAADAVWVGVELYNKWQDKYIKEISANSRNYNNTLRELSDIAEKIMTDFKENVENPLSWPIKVIAGNSMYRISQTIMLAHKDNDSQTEEELFERLSIMISDILSACLTNLVCFITLKCYSSAIIEREKSVRQAALLLGESEEILEILQQRELPGLDLEKATYIDEWRAFMEQDNENPTLPISATSTAPTNSTREHAIEQDNCDSA